MKPDLLSGPADTSAMRIVHTALRRDYARARTALTQPPYPDDAQRAALCGHLNWMTGFLHRHHESEDNSLYPMVAAANPAAATLIDAMAADHGAVQAALDAVESAVARYARSADRRADLIAALDALQEVLLPHLRREEDEMMPVVAASITEQQWRDWDQAENVKPLPLRELAFTDNWVLDDLGPADRAIIEALVPAVPRWIVKNLFGPRYRAAMFRCWRLSRHSRLKVSLAGTATAHASAPPAAVWRVLADVTRVGSGATSATRSPGPTGPPGPKSARGSAAAAAPGSRGGPARAPSPSVTHSACSPTAPRDGCWATRPSGTSSCVLTRAAR
jgi:Hemerythrin HHE cation binding domain